MRLLIVADVHDAVEMVKKIRESVDAVIAAGDFTYRGTLEASAAVLHALAELGPVYFVPGNCDPPRLADYTADGVYPLHGRVVQLGPFLVGGVGGSTPTPFPHANLFVMGEGEFEALLRGLSPTPHVFVSHDPPRGHLDRVGGVRPVGNLAVRRYIEERQPLLSVHGHIHEDRGVDLLGDTVLVNPGPLKEGYYAVAELDRTVKVELKRVR